MDAISVITTLSSSMIYDIERIHDYQSVVRTRGLHCEMVRIVVVASWVANHHLVLHCISCDMLIVLRTSVVLKLVEHITILHNGVWGMYGETTLLTTT